MLAHEGCKERDGRNTADHISDRRSPYDAVNGHRVVEDKHQRDIHQPLAQDGQQERLHALARRLEERYESVSAGREGAAQGQDAQEARAINHRIRAVLDEYANQLPAEAQADRHAQRGHGN